MDALLARYLDGDLSEEEARFFLERLEREPRLAKELREYEQILSTAHSLPRTGTPSGFTDTVMQRIAQESLLSRKTVSSQPAPAGHEHDARSWFTWRSWQGAMAIAAVLVAVFGLGRMTSTGHGVMTTQPGGTNSIVATGTSSVDVGSAPSGVATLTTAAHESPSPDFRIVRLVYVPQGNDVQSVTVAGSFNGWNTRNLPLKREGGVWTTTLVLPPGSYEYMFVENGKRWVTDPLAPHTRDDGFGNRNAVLDLGA